MVIIHLLFSPIFPELFHIFFLNWSSGWGSSAIPLVPQVSDFIKFPAIYTYSLLASNYVKNYLVSAERLHKRPLLPTFSLLGNNTGSILLITASCTALCCNLIGTRLKVKSMSNFMPLVHLAISLDSRNEGDVGNYDSQQSFPNEIIHGL